MKIPILKGAAGKVLVGLIALWGIAAFGLSDVQATEGGGGAYPNGAEGFMSGALPPPGFYFVEYLMHYSADRLVDGNGDEVPVRFKLNATASVSRFLYQSDVGYLGGKLGAYLFLPLVHASADTALGAGSKSGLGDITAGPFVSWHFSKNFHGAAAIDIAMPTGDFSRTELVNLGRNYWTFEPILALTYLSDEGFEGSVKLMYDINTENDDTGYKSGREFHFDYAVGYHAGPWTVGAVGYYYKQVTGDSGEGAATGNFKGQVIAAGPGIKYDGKRLIAEFRYQKEFSAENRPEGDRFWAKLIWPF